jgi:hypothetical protein
MSFILKPLSLAVMLSSLSMGANAQLSFCFSSSDRNNLNLQFNIIDKDWKYGFVKYNRPEYAIFVKLIEVKTINVSAGHPDLRLYNWAEIVNDSVSGNYSFLLQGDTFSEICYIRAKDKKKFKFEKVNVGFADCGCDW